MNYPEETIDERLQRLEAEDKARPDYQRRQLLHDIQYGDRPITPHDLENAKPAPPRSDEEEFYAAQSARDWAELEKFYGAAWPELRRRVVDYCNRQSKSWQEAQLAEFGRIGQVRVIKKLIEELQS